ncbi:30S ribosomal protein S8 [Candidatus Parcubacteria bacterium]|nr:MAG: 30S ribosomal protein S8 [Candidatus Parcubacteria bacterium]
MITDPISDMLTRIRNASKVKKSVVEMPLSKMKFALAKVLEKEGYLEKVEKVGESPRAVLKVTLKYDNNIPAITSIKRISKPGRRVYVKTDDIPVVLSGEGIAVLSTPNGLMTNKEAKKRRLGGEIICEVF